MRLSLVLKGILTSTHCLNNVSNIIVAVENQ